MNKSALLAAAGLLFTLHITPATAASIDTAKRAFDAGDYSKAQAELETLVKNQDPDALNLQGQMYENGWGVEQDAEQARRLYEQGARQGHLESVNSLRALKNKAYKVEFDRLLPLAEQNDGSAQNRIGEMYEFGYGVTRNNDAAIEWYRKAAEQNIVAAWHNLGRCYNFGTGVTQDYAEAESWYRKAAEQGYQDSMFFLGTLYSNAHGQDQSVDTDIAAYAWMHNAAALGNSTAATIETRLLLKLNETELQEAKTLAESYKAQYVTPFQ
ncbi:MAG: sel1 repeat family protein [Oceanospirillales bacterium]|uniref:TPR repeat protein n=1 Tax=Marinobacterium halophilum TaxID=267374 RepID=A0A2P8ESV2_9GAMM|nr:tetratricopeptide repeat protein [Marinobacterium halophilum]MBR9829758.1 sel1 repeat family protein [Oceanospirillales bacterium]PSL12561.1 TPR repeat protein [Marinobacterium halophilum]